MVFLILDYMILGLFFTGYYLYVDRELLKKANDKDRIKAFVVLFLTWYLVLLGDLVNRFVRFIIKL